MDAQIISTWQSLIWSYRTWFINATMTSIKNSLSLCYCWAQWEVFVSYEWMISSFTHSHLQNTEISELQTLFFIKRWWNSNTFPNDRNALAIKVQRILSNACLKSEILRIAFMQTHPSLVKGINERLPAQKVPRRSAKVSQEANIFL